MKNIFEKQMLKKVYKSTSLKFFLQHFFLSSNFMSEKHASSARISRLVTPADFIACELDLPYFLEEIDFQIS